MATGTEELATLVEAAEKAIEGIKDVERQRIAFGRVLDHLLKGAGQPPQGHSPVSSPASGGVETAMADSSFAEEQQRIDAIAEYFGIEPKGVKPIFNVSDDDPRLRIQSGKLPNPKANATRSIALLVTGARTALGQDTETTHIRSAADDYGKVDGSNFIQTLTAMSELSMLGKRGSPNRTVRMKVLGAEAAQALAQRLVEG